MLFDQLIDRPDKNTLADVLSGRRLDLIAPFSRRGPLDRLRLVDHDRVRIITRLPLPGSPIPKRFDNDPSDFVQLIERMGKRAQVFGLPAVHTKLYLNGATAYFGSANFTGSGFGGRPESLLATSDAATYTHLAALFEVYLEEADRLPIAFLRRLSRLLEQGQAELLASPEQPVMLRRNPLGDDAADFRNWLTTRGGADPSYVEDRFNSSAGYSMTGHATADFLGTRAFLRANRDFIPELAPARYIERRFWSDRPEVKQRLKQFAETRGDHIHPAWRTYLPESLGGRPPKKGRTKGGRTSGLAARMLILLSRYAIDRGF